jgi:hypothetical protein
MDYIQEILFESKNYPFVKFNQSYLDRFLSLEDILKMKFLSLEDDIKNYII